MVDDVAISGLMDSIHHVLHLLSKSPTSTNYEPRESESGVPPRPQVLSPCPSTNVQQACWR